METTQPNEWSDAVQREREVLLAVTAGLAQSDGGPVVGLPGLGVLSAAGALLGFPKPQSECCAEDGHSREGDLPPQEDQPLLVRQQTEEEQPDAELLLPQLAQQQTGFLTPPVFQNTSSSSSATSDVLKSLPPLMAETEQLSVDAQSPRGCPGGKRSMREGATVCFVSREGEKLMVVQNQKFWELQPCGQQESTQNAQGEHLITPTRASKGSSTLLDPGLEVL